jgi:hypothetical protein
MIVLDDDIEFIVPMIVSHRFEAKGLVPEASRAVAETEFDGLTIYPQRM